jgi:hypothetical protein
MCTRVDKSLSPYAYRTRNLRTDLAGTLPPSRAQEPGRALRARPVTGPIRQVHA